MIFSALALNVSTNASAYTAGAAYTYGVQEDPNYNAAVTIKTQKAEKIVVLNTTVFSKGRVIQLILPLLFLRSALLTLIAYGELYSFIYP